MADIILDSVVSERYERARKVAFEHRLRIANERATSARGGTLIEWAVDCGDDEIAQLNFEVALALAEFSPDPCDTSIAFGFTSVEF